MQKLVLLSVLAIGLSALMINDANAYDRFYKGPHAGMYRPGVTMNRWGASPHDAAWIEHQRRQVWLRNHPGVAHYPWRR